MLYPRPTFIIEYLISSHKHEINYLVFIALLNEASRIYRVPSSYLAQARSSIEFRLAWLLMENESMNEFEFE